MASGSIHVITGPMFSGKTSELVRRIKRFMLSNFKCIIIKHCGDNRYNEDDINKVCTHDRLFMEAIASSNLSVLVPKILKDGIEVIGIDEGQFFLDIVEFSESMANLGKIVIIAALNGDFKRELFGNVCKLLPLAETVSSLTAICVKCYREASFSKRITESKEVMDIGGKDKYMAVCRKCFFSK
ncbi:thymidine kinase [Penguinpox virus]|uniref:Thymidine kinase n=1 Tax=Penguinpox virus TaxID=648998 RepID=A0A068EEW2_9POXV|nr:thymidine kinase [Penguinpox virus]AID46824.1 thymidine kinase [Penguinpox virus]